MCHNSEIDLWAFFCFRVRHWLITEEMRRRKTTNLLFIDMFKKSDVLPHIKMLNHRTCLSLKPSRLRTFVLSCFHWNCIKRLVFKNKRRTLDAYRNRVESGGILTEKKFFYYLSNIFPFLFFSFMIRFLISLSRCIIITQLTVC